MMVVTIITKFGWVIINHKISTNPDSNNVQILRVESAGVTQKQAVLNQIEMVDIWFNMELVFDIHCYFLTRDRAFTWMNFLI